MAFRLGILGAGNISDTHARAASAIPGVEVVAVHGRNRERATRLAGAYGAAVFDSLDGFLDHPMDAVAIGSPSGVHAEQGSLAAARGLHLIVEKPIDVTPARADLLIDAAARADVRLGVFFQDRVQPDIVRLRDAIVSGRIGRPLVASARVKWYRPPEYYGQSHWRGTWALDGGGALMNQGIHTVDLMQWLLGPVRRLSATTRTALHKIEVEDTVIALLEFESGAVATLEATTAAYLATSGVSRSAAPRARWCSSTIALCVPTCASPPTIWSPRSPPTTIRAPRRRSSRTREDISACSKTSSMPSTRIATQSAQDRKRERASRSSVRSMTRRSRARGSH